MHAAESLAFFRFVKNSRNFGSGENTQPLKSSQVKSRHLYLGRVAPSAIGWYLKGPCVKLGLHGSPHSRFLEKEELLTLTDLKVPLLPGIFQWGELKTPLLFSSEPKSPKFWTN